MLSPLAVEILGADGVTRCGEALRRGELVVFPTETAYGLGARALDEAAVRRIFEAKGRPATHPVIVHVSGLDEARTRIPAFDERAARFAKAFWPGPLALILPRPESISRAVTGGGDTVAVRCPAHPLAQALLRALGEPIAAPSANRYQSLSPTRIDHLDPLLTAHVAFALDGGPTERGIESTVLDLSGRIPAVLRPGSISLSMLRAVDAEVILGPGQVTGDTAHRSPGLDVRHYAPRTPLAVVRREGLFASVRALAPLRVALVHHSAPTSNEDAGDGVGPSGARLYRLANDPDAYARDLFATLHEADRAGVDWILVERPPEDERWAGVHDRLKRAATRLPPSLPSRAE